MFDYISGKLVTRKPNYCVIDANGVGYRLEIPLSTYERLPASGPVKLLAYLKVAEDDQRLFGFGTEAERGLFLQLLGVSQLGPAKAIQILSGIAPAELSRSIAARDLNALKRIKGIGDKLAGRIIVELQGKLPEDYEGKGAELPSKTRDAVEALVALGYERAVADAAVRRAQKGADAAAGVEDLIRRSLAHV